MNASWVVLLMWVMYDISLWKSCLMTWRVSKFVVRRCEEMEEMSVVGRWILWPPLYIGMKVVWTANIWA